MRTVRSEQPPPRLQSRPWFRGFLLLACLATAAVQAEPTEQICEYRTLELDMDSGDIRFIAPQKTGPEDCTDTGAAIGELDPGWRRQLPPRVRWRQRADAPNLCQSPRTELGQRTAELAGQGCVFLLPREVCTIVTGQPVSHAQLANAVRHCVP